MARPAPQLPCADAPAKPVEDLFISRRIIYLYIHTRTAALHCRLHVLAMHDYTVPYYGQHGSLERGNGLSIDCPHACRD